MAKIRHIALTTKDPSKVAEFYKEAFEISRRNATDRPRRALGISYLEADTSCLRRRRAPRRFQPMFEAGV